MGGVRADLGEKRAIRKCGARKTGVLSALSQIFSRMTRMESPE